MPSLLVASELRSSLGLTQEEWAQLETFDSAFQQIISESDQLVMTLALQKAMARPSSTIFSRELDNIVSHPSNMTRLLSVLDPQRRVQGSFRMFIKGHTCRIRDIERNYDRKIIAARNIHHWYLCHRKTKYNEIVGR